MASILVVDDRAINREFLVALLGYGGHEVSEARDGRQALDIAREIVPDLIITDILMPTMDGVEFTRRLSADRDLCSIPVIFYTATYRVGEARSLAAECGVSTVIAKPSDPQELLNAVQGELGLAEHPMATDEARALAARAPLRSVDRLCATAVEELTGLKLSIQTAIEVDDTPSAKARQLQSISGEVHASLNRAQALSMRLAALIELGLELAEQREPEPMLAMFCRAGRDIMNARIAVVCLLTETGTIVDFSTCGMTAEQTDEVRGTFEPTARPFAEVMTSGDARRFAGLHERGAALGLPRAHPAVDNLLAVPIRSSSRTYGFFYVGDRIGAREFSEEDEQLIQTLVAQLVPAYENLELIDGIKRHAQILEIEADERKQAIAALRESEERFRQLAENIREVFFLIDAATGDMLYVSPTYEEVWERSTASLQYDARSWLDAVHRDDYARVLQHFSSGQSTGHFRLKYRIHCSSGIRWIKAQTFPILNVDGELDRIAGIAEDITESELQELKIRRLSRIQAMLSGINSAIVRIRERGELLDEACRIAAVHGHFPLAWIGLFQAKGTRIEFVSYHGTNPAAAAEISGALVDGAVARHGLASVPQRSGSRVVINDIEALSGRDRVLNLALSRGYRSAIGLPLLPDGKPAGAVVLFAEESHVFDDEETKLLDELAGDVSFALEYIARDERLTYLAYYDTLTELPNMTLFREQLETEIGSDADTQIAVFLIDLDRFTQLNDTHGRNVGDHILIAVGKRLKSTLSGRGKVARVGSDTFAIAASSLRLETEAASILQDLIFTSMRRPFALKGVELRISARVGVAAYPTDGGDAETLFTNAEAALAEAKASGARFLFYSADLNERVAEDLALEQKLHAAIRDEEFLLYYQPKIDAGDGTIIGLEALLRWSSNDNGIVSPATFIPVLESSEMILDVGRWVLDQSLADYKVWAELGLHPPRIAVNVSPVQLRYADFVDLVVNALERHGVEGAALELEITESVIMANIEETIPSLELLTQKGVTIAIDDFGTGYSSLRYLAKLPVHALKIDRSFVVAMTDHADDLTLVTSIIGLAHGLGLKVVAEGVDADEQAKFLRLIKCDVMQGYLFGRPQPAADIARLLAAQVERLS
jgi:diguanylate cyclase (GGDEF)-like protein/PAS domain S-box-containing protein